MKRICKAEKKVKHKKKLLKTLTKNKEINKL